MNALNPLVLVGLGGALGAIARWQLGRWVLQLAPMARFPWPTLAVNLAGCLLIGLVAGLVERHAASGAGARLFLMTGLLGGFTTFSAFGLETLVLLRRGDGWIAAAYVACSVLGGLFAVWLGMRSVGAFTALAATMQR